MMLRLSSYRNRVRPTNTTTPFQYLVGLAGKCSILNDKLPSSKFCSALYFYHNAYRSKFALGIKVLNITRDWKKTLMTGLVYNCHFEELAKKVLDYKGKRYQSWRYGVMINHFESPVPDRSSKIALQKTKEAIRSWLKDFPSFQRLMYPNVPYVGCAYTHIITSGRLYIKIACAYPNNRPRWGPFIPAATGYSCRNDGDCKRFGWLFTCVVDVGLCFAPFDMEYWIK